MGNMVLCIDTTVCVPILANLETAGPWRNHLVEIPGHIPPIITKKSFSIILLFSFSIAYFSLPSCNWVAVVRWLSNLKWTFLTKAPFFVCILIMMCISHFG